MSHQFINVEKKGHITILTMNRPEVLNAIHPMISREMSRAINEFDEDAQQWVMIVTGAGDRAFSAGNDLKFTAANGAARVKELMAGLKGGFGGITNRHDCSKPFIAAVNGFAFGGGFEIALACDIIIAAENALFSFPEPRVGLMAAVGGAHRLPRRIPYHLAMEMLLTSNRVGAEQGREYGFVNKVAPSEQLMSTAEAYAGDIMKGAPLSIRASKEAVNAGMDYSLNGGDYQEFSPYTKQCKNPRTRSKDQRLLPRNVLLGGKDGKKDDMRPLFSSCRRDGATNTQWGAIRAGEHGSPSGPD